MHLCSFFAFFFAISFHIYLSLVSPEIAVVFLVESCKTHWKTLLRFLHQYYERFDVSVWHSKSKSVDCFACCLWYFRVVLFRQKFWIWEFFLWLFIQLYVVVIIAFICEVPRFSSFFCFSRRLTKPFIYTSHHFVQAIPRFRSCWISSVVESREWWRPMLSVNTPHLTYFLRLYTRPADRKCLIVIGSYVLPPTMVSIKSFDLVVNSLTLFFLCRL